MRLVKHSALFILTLLTACNGSRVDWNKTYSRGSEHPYGCSVTYDLLPSLFPGEEVNPIRRSIYDEVEIHESYLNFIGREESLLELEEPDTGVVLRDSNELKKLEEASFFTDNFKRDDVFPINFIFISDFFKIEDYDATALDYHVKNANTCLIAAHHIETTIYPLQNIELLPYSVQKDSVTIQTGDYSAVYKASDVSSYIHIKDDSSVEVIATTRDKKPVAVAVKSALGKYIVCSSPEIFTNYYILKSENAKVLQAILTLLPIEEVKWCGNYLSRNIIKFGNNNRNNSKDDRSIMQFIHREPSLVWAFYLAVLGGLFLMFFSAKRKQKIIPVIKKPQNTTIKFVETLSNLYLRENSHKSIANKKIAYFIDLIHSKYHVMQIDFADDTFRERIANRSGNSFELTNEICDDILMIKSKSKISTEELINLTQLINKFCYGIRK